MMKSWRDTLPSYFDETWFDSHLL